LQLRAFPALSLWTSGRRITWQETKDNALLGNSSTGKPCICHGITNGSLSLLPYRGTHAGIIALKRQPILFLTVAVATFGDLNFPCRNYKKSRWRPRSTQYYFTLIPASLILVLSSIFLHHQYIITMFTSESSPSTRRALSQEEESMFNTYVDHNTHCDSTAAGQECFDGQAYPVMYNWPGAHKDPFAKSRRHEASYDYLFWRSCQASMDRGILPESNFAPERSDPTSTIPDYYDPKMFVNADRNPQISSDSTDGTVHFITRNSKSDALGTVSYEQLHHNPAGLNAVKTRHAVHAYARPNLQPQLQMHTQVYDAPSKPKTKGRSFDDHSSGSSPGSTPRRSERTKKAVKKTDYSYY